MDDDDLLRTAADRLERLAGRTTPGEWRLAGLLASRPEVLAHRPDGSTEHVAEARASSAGWIAVMSPAVAGPLATWLRAAAERRPADAAAERRPADAAAAEVARLLVERLPGG